MGKLCLWSGSLCAANLATRVCGVYSPPSRPTQSHPQHPFVFGLLSLVRLVGALAFFWYRVVLLVAASHKACCVLARRSSCDQASRPALRAALSGVSRAPHAALDRCEPLRAPAVSCPRTKHTHTHTHIFAQRIVRITPVLALGFARGVGAPPSTLRRVAHAVPVSFCAPCVCAALHCTAGAPPCTPASCPCTPRTTTWRSRFRVA